MTVRVACVIPAFQAAHSVSSVTAGLRASLPDAFLVGVDDGSTDETGAVLRSSCDAVVHFPINRGKGAALRAGCELALARGAAAVLTIDADGQHDPAAAPSLLGALSGADVVVGVRERSGSRMPLARRFTNGASALAMSACTRTALRDPQSGYRAYGRSVLERVDGRGDRYEYESDLLLAALRAGFRLAQVRVPTIYGPPSHFLTLSDTARVVGTIARHCVRSIAAGALAAPSNNRAAAASPSGLAS